MTHAQVALPPAPAPAPSPKAKVPQLAKKQRMNCRVVTRDDVVESIRCRDRPPALDLGLRGRVKRAQRGRGAQDEGRYGRPLLALRARDGQLAVERATGGRKVKGRCRPATRRNQRRRRCTLHRKLKGSFTHAGRQGPNSLRFTRRLGGRRLDSGRYGPVTTATDAVGNRSKPKRLGFTIIKR